MSREFRRAQRKKGESFSESIEKRKKTHPVMYVGLVVLLVVIVVTFVLAGPGGIMGRGSIGGGGNIVFGSYGGQEISYAQGNYFAQQVQQYANQVKSSSIPTDNTTQTYQVWYQAFMSTAEHLAILQQADHAGVSISEDAVDKALLSYSGYLDENGKFSEDKFNAASAADKSATRKITRENLRSGAFVNDVISGAKDGTKESDFIKAMVRPERSFTFVTFPFSSFPNEEVRKYGEANKSRFVRSKLSRILVKTGESQATEIRKKILDKTSTFEELARTYSKDSYADKGGDMGWRYAYDLEADFEAKENAQKVLQLKTGELSDVLKGTFGWMIYRSDSEAADADFTNATIQADVRTYITTYEKGKIEDYFNERAAQLSRRAAEAGFDAAAREMGLKVSSTVFFPINLSSVFSFAPLKAVVDADTPANAASSEDFFYRAFTLGKDQVSAPIVLDNQVLVLKLKGEQQMADSAASIVPNWVPYAANQSVQYDLYSVLMTPDKLTNDFDTAFSTYVAPSSAKQ
jgi:parvulin-like peptidyl-prolyl isomerase